MKNKYKIIFGYAPRDIPFDDFLITPAFSFSYAYHENKRISQAWAIGIKWGYIGLYISLLQFKQKENTRNEK